MVRTTAKRAARRALSRHGEPVTHVTYSSNSTDAYGDEEWSATETDVTAWVRFDRSAGQGRTAAETDVDQFVSIYVDDSVVVSDETEAIRPDEFELAIDGWGDEWDTIQWGGQATRFKVVRANHDNSGLIECQCRVVN